jgi:hypothetical protein
LFISVTCLLHHWILNPFDSLHFFFVALWHWFFGSYLVSIIYDDNLSVMSFKPLYSCSKGRCRWIVLSYWSYRRLHCL